MFIFIFEVASVMAWWFLKVPSLNVALNLLCIETRQIKFNDDYDNVNHKLEQNGFARSGWTYNSDHCSKFEISSVSLIHFTFCISYQLHWIAWYACMLGLVGVCWYPMPYTPQFFKPPMNSSLFTTRRCGSGYLGLDVRSVCKVFYEYTFCP